MVDDTKKLWLREADHDKVWAEGGGLIATTHRQHRNAYAKRIIACHNGCIGIEEPETTVPELVAMCCKLTEQFDEASQYKGEFLRKKHGDDDLVAEAGALLAKTGTRPT